MTLTACGVVVALSSARLRGVVVPKRRLSERLVIVGPQTVRETYPGPPRASRPPHAGRGGRRSLCRTVPAVCSSSPRMFDIRRLASGDAAAQAGRERPFRGGGGEDGRGPRSATARGRPVGGSRHRPAGVSGPWNGSRWWSGKRVGVRRGEEPGGSPGGDGALVGWTRRRDENHPTSQVSQSRAAPAGAGARSQVRGLEPLVSRVLLWRAANRAPRRPCL